MLNMFSFDPTSALSMAFYLALAFAIATGCIIAFKRGGPAKQSWDIVYALLILVVPFIAGLFVAGNAGTRMSPITVCGNILVALMGTAVMTTASMFIWTAIFKLVDKAHPAYGTFRQLTFDSARRPASHAVEPSPRPETPALAAVSTNASAPKAAAA